MHASLDMEALARALGPLLVVESAATDRQTYLLRPDLGRQLAPGTALPQGAYDLAIVLADGLSAQAVQDHGPPVVQALAAPCWPDGASPRWLRRGMAGWPWRTRSPRHWAPGRSWS